MASNTSVGFCHNNVIIVQETETERGKREGCTWLGQLRAADARLTVNQ